MDRLRMSVAECKYKETDRQLKEQFINDLNDSDMSVKIIRELTKIEDNKTL